MLSKAAAVLLSFTICNVADAAFLSRVVNAGSSRLNAASSLDLNRSTRRSVQDPLNATDTNTTPVYNGPRLDSPAVQRVKQMISEQLEHSQARLVDELNERDYCKMQQASIKSRLHEQAGVVQEKLFALDQAKFWDKQTLKAQQKMAEDARYRTRSLIWKSTPAPTGRVTNATIQWSNYSKLGVYNFTTGETMAAAGATNLVARRKSKQQGGKTSTSKRKSKKHEDEAVVAVSSANSTNYTGPPVREADDRDSEMAVKMAKYELRQEKEALENLVKEKQLIHNRCVAKVDGEETYTERKFKRDNEIKALNRAWDILDNKDLYKRYG